MDRFSADLHEPPGDSFECADACSIPSLLHLKCWQGSTLLKNYMTAGQKLLTRNISSVLTTTGANAAMDE
jgi:hypothetical protein